MLYSKNEAVAFSKKTLVSYDAAKSLTAKVPPNVTAERFKKTIYSFERIPRHSLDGFSAAKERNLLVIVRLS